MKTSAADISIVTMSGPSILGEEVITMKHRTAQNRVRSTHWVLLSGFRIIT
ncbi:MAG: hypothetical protein SOX26_04375 [Phocaeicola sp.]|nr:hypothetical protein [Phocaeicola sp.]